MSSFLARLWTQRDLAYCPHTDASGETWQPVKHGIATSNGAAGGTTLVDTGGDSGGADTYNGRFWVEITKGTNKGMRKRIIDDDGAGTLTFENNGFDNQVDSGDEYRVLLSPDPVILVDSVTATTVVDAVRAEPDDFWNGYFLAPITANDRGIDPVVITDFTSATGTFTIASGALSNVAAGDVLVLRKFLTVTPPSAGWEHPYIPRPGNRPNFSRSDGTPGARGGTFGFNTQVRCSNALSGDGVKAGSSNISGLFQAAGLDEKVDTTSTVGAGSTTTAIKIATGSWENHTVGNMIIWNGNAAFIESMTDGVGAEDTLNVTPALPTAPASGELIYATRGYHKSTSGDALGVLIEFEVDGYRTIMTGCKGNVTLADGPAPEMQWALSIDDFIRENEAAPYMSGTAHSSAPPILSQDRLVYLGSTKTDVGALTATPGTVVVAKDVSGKNGINGRSGYQVANFAGGMSWRELGDANTTGMPHELRYTARTAKDVIAVMGGGSNTFAARAPVGKQIESPHPTEADSKVGLPIVWDAQDAGTGVDGASASQKIPDFAFHLT